MLVLLRCFYDEYGGSFVTMGRGMAVLSPIAIRRQLRHQERELTRVPVVFFPAAFAKTPRHAGADDVARADLVAV
jgi:hypothetical protein